MVVMTTTADIRHLAEETVLFSEAASWVASVVVSITAEAWDGPGLGGWNMRALVGHTSRALLTVEKYLASSTTVEDVGNTEDYYTAAAHMAGAEPADVLQRGIDAGVALGEDPAATFVEAVDRVLPLLDDEQDRIITTIVGGMRLSNYLPTRTFELIVHGLDITEAADLSMSPPDASLRHALALATAVASRTGDGPALLMALTGRRDLATGYSVL